MDDNLSTQQFSFQELRDILANLNQIYQTSPDPNSGVLFLSPRQAKDWLENGWLVKTPTGYEITDKLTQDIVAYWTKDKG